MQEQLTISLIEFDIAWGDKLTNLSKLDALLSEIRTPTDIIILPETFNTGFFMNEELSEGMNGLTVQWMLQKAKELNSAIVGSLLIREEYNIFNRAVFATPDGILASYDKQNLFILSEEHKLLTAGNKNTIVSWKGWNIGLFICFDLRFPLDSWNINNDGSYKYDLAIYMANWPAVRNHHWEALLKARAIENRCYVAGVNRIGTAPDGTEYIGNSAICDFNGMKLNASEDFMQSIATSKEKLQIFRKQFAPI